MDKIRAAVHAPFGRVVAGTTAVLALSLTFFALTPAPAAQPDSLASTAQPSVTSAMSTEVSAAAAGTGAIVGEVTPATTAEPTDESTTRSAAAPIAIAPETVSTPDPPSPLPTTPDPPIEPARPDAETLVTGRVMHATESVNIRDVSGVDGSTVIGIVPGDQQVSGGDTVDGWVPVQFGEIYGWVSASYLAEGPAAGPGVPTPGPPVDSPDNWMTDLIPQVDPTGHAFWVLERNGAWGASDGHAIYLDPNMPADKHYSVMVHEYSHVLEARVYGSLTNSVAALSAIIGGSPTDVRANESTADCMALMQGATWVNYGCRDELRPAAAAILAGNRP